MFLFLNSDETSMVGSSKLMKINYRLQEMVNGEDQQKYMGGKSVVVSGNFSPVMAKGYRVRHNISVANIDYLRLIRTPNPSKTTLTLTQLSINQSQSQKP